MAWVTGTLTTIVALLALLQPHAHAPGGTHLLHRPRHQVQCLAFDSNCSSIVTNNTLIWNTG
jgi:hypothetical protein